MRRMNIAICTSVGTAVALGLLTLAPLPVRAQSDPLKAGERLVHALDCNICHSPKVFTEQGPQPDPTRLLSGHPANLPVPALPTGALGPEGWGGLFNPHMTAWAGPWGISFAMNLTPDDETGMGVWTEDLFRNAIRNGKHMGVGRPILPPMPWQAYSVLTDEEIHSIFLYLKSLPPVKNAVPAPVPPGGPGK